MYPIIQSSGKQAIDAFLTKREKQVIELMAKGKTNKEVARALIISSETVKKHIQNIYQKLGTHNKIEAINRVLLIKLTQTNSERFN